MKLLPLAFALLTQQAVAQVVVIYSHHDRQAAERVRSVVAVYEPALIDREIPPGANWRSIMGQAICNARMVLLVWSARAAESQEVGAEWRIAAACGRRLVAVTLDSTPLPAEASTVQGLDWR